MFREFKTKNLKMNVVMKDGREFLGCDTTINDFGRHHSITHFDFALFGHTITFWNDGVVRLVNVSDVQYVDFYNAPDEPEPGAPANDAANPA